MSQGKQMVEAIITHPGKTITVADIVKNTTGIKVRYIQNQMSKLVIAGLLGKGVKAKYAGPKTFEILSREPLPDARKKAAPKKVMTADERNKSIKRIIARTEPRTDLSSAETGRSIILAYKDLEVEVRELNLKNESMHSEINKERSARKVAVADRDKTITDLKARIVLLQAKIKELEHQDDLKFDLGNTPRLKALNGRKM